ncbi:MAG TPA: hypothetical protein VHE35_15170 [Kofleriaceae bacterium]|nr:hypothetical protein [Kofleriaceae bacterium]
MKRIAFLCLAAASCMPAPPPPIHYGPPPSQAPSGPPSAAQPAPPGPGPGPAEPAPPYGPPPGGVAQATCSDTLQCYGACNPLTDACVGGCDQRSSPDAVQAAHAALQCMAQSGCADQGCVVQRCAAPLQTCTGGQLAQQPPPPPAPSGPQGSYDLVYQVPQGWNESRTYRDAITLGFDQEDFYNHLHPRLHVFPSRPRRGAIDDDYLALWNELIVAPGEFTGTPTPSPLRRRTAGGYAMALDAKQTNLANGGGYVTVGLYVVYSDDELIPILATNVDWHFKDVATTFFDGLTLRGEAPSRTPLFDRDELAGHWSTQSTSVSTYVTSSGAYAGDASIATADTLDLARNGRFHSHFVGVGRGNAVQEDDEGRWSVRDDLLVLEGKARTETRRIWGRGAAPQGAADALCLVHYGDAQPQYFSPEDGINTSWYGPAR